MIDLNLLGGLAFAGAVAVTPELMVFVGEPERGDSPCFAGNEVSVYTYKYDGKQFTLTAVNDSCILRKVWFQQKAWVKN